jgi:hypothetical protein
VVEAALGRGFLRVLRYSFVGIIPPMFRTHLYLSIVSSAVARVSVTRHEQVNTV